jgi:hypothetical protein
VEDKVEYKNGQIDYERRRALKLLASSAASAGAVALVPGASAMAMSTYVSLSSEGKQLLDAQKMITDAIAGGRHIVTLPQGRFHLKTNGIKIQSAHDLVVEGAGREQTVLISDMWAGTSVAVLESQRITLRNFSVDRDPLPFVPATITQVKNVTDTTIALDFEVHAGYAKLTAGFMDGMNGVAQFFDKATRLLKRPDRGFGLANAKNILRFSDDKGQILLTNDWKGRIVEGDYVVFKSGNGAGFILDNSTTIRLEDVGILASASIGLGAHFLTGDNYFRYTIKPGPPPEGATEARLAATNADGMQYSSSPGAVIWDKCDCGFMGDDGINISTTAFKVIEIHSPTHLRATIRLPGSHVQKMVAMSKPGDVVRVERFGTYEPFGDLPLKSIAIENTGKTGDGHEMAYVDIELHKAASSPVSPGDIFVLRKFLPTRFVIKNSHFHDTRARGIIISGSNGLIENNVIERTALAGMEFLQEFATYGAGDWVSDILVRNNTVRDVCWADNDRTNAVAAIEVINRPAKLPGEPAPFYPWIPAHRNLSFIGNTIENCPSAGILLNGVDGGEVRDNVIRKTNQNRGGMEASYKPGEPMSVPYAITVMNSKNVKVANNDVSDLGQHARGPVGDIGTFPVPEQKKD